MSARQVVESLSPAAHDMAVHDPAVATLMASLGVRYDEKRRCFVDRAKDEYLKDGAWHLRVPPQL